MARHLLLAGPWLVVLALLLGPARSRGAVSMPFDASCYVTRPGGLAMGDVNLDGRPDIIVRGDSLQIWAALGSDDGTFTRRIGISVPGEVDVALADLDGDGRLDLAVVSDDPSSTNNGAMYTARGDGSGRFTLLARYPVYGHPVCIASGDFDGDGRQDLAVGESWNRQVVLFWAVGTFQPTIGTSLWTDRSPEQIVVAELNGDPRTDLVVAFDGRVLVYRSVSTGGWSNTSMLTAGSPTVALGDCDGDGALDLAIANRTPYVLSVLHGKGDGTFGAPADYPLIFESRHPVSFGDWNGDGHLDLAAANQVRPGKGDGTFGPSALHPAGRGTTRHFTADMDGDGRLDLVMSVNGLLVFPAALGGGVQPEAAFRTPAASSEVQLQDLNGDSRPDFIVPDTGAIDYETAGHTVSVALGDGDGGFGRLQSFEVGYRPTSVAVADFDRDGNPDLAVACCYSDRIVLLRGRGEGTFGDRQDLPTNVYPITVLPVDMNQDGLMDLAVAQQLAGKVGIFLGNGDGTFAARVDCPSGNKHPNMAAGDLNGDRWPDLVVGNNTDNLEYVPASVSVLYGSESGIPRFAAEIWVRENPVSGLAIADFDRDGIADLALSYRFGAARVLYGPLLTRTPSFSEIPLPFAADRIVHADFDRDGWEDLAISAGSPALVSILHGRPGRTFSPRIDLGVSLWPQALAVADLNEDSAPDLVVTNRLDSTATVLRNRDVGSQDGIANLTATGRKCDIVLRWSLPPTLLAEAVRVHVRRSTKSAGPFADVSPAPQLPLAEAEMIVGALPDTAYWFAVVVDLRDGCVRTAVTPEVRAAEVGAPGIRDFQVSSSPGFAELEWQLPADSLSHVPGVDVKRSTSPAGPFGLCTQGSLMAEPLMKYLDTTVQGGSRYWYRIVVRTDCGMASVSPAISTEVPHWKTAYEPPHLVTQAPARFRYSVAPPGGDVELALYDIRGRLVRRLDRGARAEGLYTVEWNGTDDRGEPAARGVYLARLKTPEHTFTSKVVWLGR